MEIGFCRALEFILVSDNEHLHRSAIGMDVTSHDETVAAVVPDTAEYDKFPAFNAHLFFEDKR
jgi:hypothetical protein